MNIILLPFKLIWFLLELVLNLTGRIICAALGLALMIVGLLLIVTVIGAIVGVPLLIFGILLLVRAVFR